MIGRICDNSVRAAERARSNCLFAKYKSAIIQAAVFIIAFASWAYLIDYGFVWDDNIFILDNLFIQDISNFFKLFVSGDAVGTDPSYHNPYYRPIATASFMLNHFFAGNNPAGYHIVNVIAHAIVCVLLFKTAEYIFEDSWAAFAAAVIFCVHPANLEPVAWISARADIICGIFLLTSFLFFLKFSKERRPLLYYLSLIAFAAAVFTKIVAVLLPVLLFLDIKKTRLSRAYLLPFFMVVFVFWIVRDAVIYIESFFGSTWDVRFATGPTLVINYLINTLFPFMLSPFYRLLVRLSFADPVVILSWLALIVIAGGVVLSYRKSRLAIFGIIWYFVFLLPVSGFYILFPLSLIADRYLYIPLMGFSLAVGFALGKLRAVFAGGRFGKIRLTPLLIAIVLGFGVYNFGRSQIWRNNIAFWENAFKVAKENQTSPGEIEYISRNYALGLMEFGRFEEARVILGELRQKQEKDAPPDPYLDYFIAQSLIGLGNYNEAFTYSVKAMHQYPDNPRFIAQLGKISMLKGEYRDSADYSRAALSMDPWVKDARETMQQLEKAGAL